MSKALSIFGIATAILLLLVFALDLAVGFFRADNMVMDIGFIVAAAILGYLSWNTLREQT